MENSINLATVLLERDRDWKVSPTIITNGRTTAVELLNDSIKDMIMRVIVSLNDNSERTVVFLKCIYLDKYVFEWEKELETNQELLDYLKRIRKISYDIVEDIDKEIEELFNHKLHNIVK